MGSVPRCCPPAALPQALLSLSCVVASKTWKSQGIRDTATTMEGFQGVGVGNGHRYQSRWPGSQFLACPRPESTLRNGSKYCSALQ